MSNHDDRRRAERYPHRAHATLMINNNAYPAHIINISVIGALVAVVDDHDIKEGQEMAIDIDSDSGNFSMRGTVAHVKNHYIGLECVPPDDASMETIKRVIECINEQVED